MHVLFSGWARGQCPHAEGPRDDAASGLRLRGVPERGRRGLLHQDHEHDQGINWKFTTVRQRKSKWKKNSLKLPREWTH